MKKISIAIRALGFFLKEIALASAKRMLNPNTTKQKLRTVESTTGIIIISDLKKALPTPYMKHLSSIRRLD